MPTFRVRQAVTCYVETTIEAPSKGAIFDYAANFDLEEQFEDALESLELGPWSGDLPELVEETDKAPRWKLEGDKLVPIKKRVG